MYREGLPAAYLVVGTLLTIIFISTLKFGLVLTILTSFILGALYYYLRKKRAKKVSIFPIIAMVLLCGLVSFSTNMVYENVFKQHHRDRFSLWLRLDNEITNNDQLKRTVGYNTHQSETAIGSGGILGKRFHGGNTYQRKLCSRTRHRLHFYNIRGRMGIYRYIISCITIYRPITSSTLSC